MSKTLKNGKSVDVTVGGGKVQPKAGPGGGVNGLEGGSPAHTEQGQGVEGSKSAEKRLFELVGEGEGNKDISKRLKASTQRLWALYVARIAAADTVHTHQQAKTLFVQCLEEAEVAARVWDSCIGNLES